MVRDLDQVLTTALGNLTIAKNLNGSQNVVAVRLNEIDRALLRARSLLEQLGTLGAVRDDHDPVLMETARQLGAYFAGRLKEFDLPLDWQLSHEFRRRALRAVNRIPYGQTRTYMQVAKSAGNERAVRAAGTACGRNPIPIVVPCHRVLRTGGGLGGYGGGLPMKEALLELEGTPDV